MCAQWTLVLWFEFCCDSSLVLNERPEWDVTVGQYYAAHSNGFDWLKIVLVDKYVGVQWGVMV